MKKSILAIAVLLALATPAAARSQLEGVVGVPGGMFTLVELVTMHGKLYQSGSDRSPTLIIRDKADRERLEPRFQRLLRYRRDIYVIFQ